MLLGLDKTNAQYTNIDIRDEKRETVHFFVESRIVNEFY